MSDIELDYDYLTQNALRQVMIDVLKITADLGEAPGEHHFYIEFLTGAANVSIPDTLKTEYPERMTIVLQHQFEDLIVTEEGFSVKLFFKGNEAHLIIPFTAVTSFADPAAQFGLQFVTAPAQDGQPDTADEEREDAPPADSATSETPHETPSETDDPEAPPKATGDVVNLDAFRKK